MEFAQNEGFPLPQATYSDKSSSVAVLFNARNGYDGYYKQNGVKFTDYDPYDVTDFRGSVGLHKTHLLKVFYNSGTVKVNDKLGDTWGCSQEVGTVQINKWYHTDMIVDLDSDVYDVWIDGTKVTATPLSLRSDRQGVNEFKGFALLQEDGPSKVGYYDNIAITHYTANDTIQMVADAGKNGIGASTADGKLLNVAFNDSFSDTFRPEDFEIKDSDGNKVEEFTV